MPVPGLSLVGFMEEAFAIDYLSRTCVLPDASREAFRCEWDAARMNIGGAVPRAGQPEIRDLRARHASYLDAIRHHPRFADFAQAAVTFKLVEIDPLLAFQFHIETERSESLAAPSGKAPNVTDTLAICLPQTLEEIQAEVRSQPNGLWIRTRNANVRILGPGQLVHDPAARMSVAGPVVGLSNPFIQVVRFDGRCYLRNGFHRAYGLRRAGATHIPCLFWDVADWPEVGAPGLADGTFGRELLESSNPPTLAHFTQGRAYPVQLRVTTRMIHITWSDDLYPSEY